MATVNSIPFVLFLFILLAVLAATQSDNIMKSTSWKEGGISKGNEKKVMMMKNNEEGNSIKEGDEKVYIDFCKEEKCVYKDLDLEVSCYCCMNVLLYAKKECWGILEECHSKCPPYGRPPKIFPTP